MPVGAGDGITLPPSQPSASSQAAAAQHSLAPDGLALMAELAEAREQMHLPADDWFTPLVPSLPHVEAPEDVQGLDGGSAQRRSTPPPRAWKLEPPSPSSTTSSVRSDDDAGWDGWEDTDAAACGGAAESKQSAVGPEGAPVAESD